MNDEEMDENLTGLGALQSSLSQAIRGGGPLSDVISRSLRKAGVPESIEADYEPMPETQEEARRREPASTTPFRDRYIAQLEEATQRLLAPKPEPKTIIGKLVREFAIPTGKSGDFLVARQERAEKEMQDDLKRREAILNILGKQTELERQKALDEATQKRYEAEEQRRIAEANKPKNLQADAQKIIDLQSIVDSKDPSVPQSAKDAAAREISSIGRKNSPEDRSILGQLIRANQMLSSKNPEEVQAAQSFIARYSGSGKPSLTLAQKTKDTAIKNAKEFLATVNDKERAAAFAAPYPNERQLRIRKSVELANQPTYEEVATKGGFSVEPFPDEDEG